ncbi:hypothetical protein V5799_004837 [Amblyomma americanum]|uniref:Uncharacterized protein n=1 Tax=Amblyomma americanum TaxID=6943 RepID=A0AAQ4D4Z1_AMBAM
MILPTVNDVLANAWFGTTVPTLFLLQSHLLSMLVPGVFASIVSYVHLSLLFSLSVFEYTWFSQGWEPHRRVSFVEDNWIYFMGFGLPLVFVTSLSSSYFIRCMLFSTAFPVFFSRSLTATPITGLSSLSAAKAFFFSLLYSDQDSANIRPSLQALLDHICEALWVLPPFLVTKVVGSYKLQEIADNAHRRIPEIPRIILPTVNDVLANAWFGTTVPTLFLLQSHLLSMLVPGALVSIVSYVHLSLLFSLFAFEYTWFSQGWEPHRGVSFVEDNWIYFLGFGLPLVFVTSLSSSYFIRGMLFMTAFPLFFRNSLVATPVTGLSRFPLRLFTPAVWVFDTFSRFAAVIRR